MGKKEEEEEEEEEEERKRRRRKNEERRRDCFEFKDKTILKKNNELFTITEIL